jgi:Outer membrane protein beta-barrel domain
MLSTGRWVFLAFVLFRSPCSSAQESSLGIRVGPSFSSFFSSATAYTFLGGVTAGVYTRRWVSDNWSLQPELLYARMGAKRVVNPYTIIPVKLDYVRLPIMGLYYITNSINLHAGPDLGYLISAHERIGQEDEDLSPNFNRFDVAVAAGVSFQLQERLDLTFRYTYGLTQLVKEPSTEYPTNRALQITFGYTWVSFANHARSRGGGRGTRRRVRKRM